ncbi:MAG: hypothetical protein KGR26_08270 [Cyanobacteria bacterium REEB65]|nr:hypothetical protein [Cyanobacteria bacterium REEB65]
MDLKDLPAAIGDFFKGAIKQIEQNPGAFVAEAVDDVKLAAALIGGNKADFEADLKQAIADAPGMPDVWKPFLESDLIVDAIGDALIKQAQDAHAAALDKATAPPAPSQEIAHIGQDTNGQVVTDPPSAN